MNWQSIATVPKDGSIVIGFWPRLERPVLMRWATMSHVEYEPIEGDTFRRVEHKDRGYWSVMSETSPYGAGGGGGGEPSHWMPLPAPPKQI